MNLPLTQRVQLRESTQMTYKKDKRWTTSTKQALQICMTGIKTDSRKEVDKQAINFSMFSSPELFLWANGKRNTVYLSQSLREAEAIENLINSTYKSYHNNLPSKFRKQISMHIL